MKSKKIVKYIASSLLVIVVLLLLWGVSEPYFIDRQEEVAVIPNLPEAWQGKQVGLLSDFQYGMWLDNTPTVRRSVAMLVEQRPAFVLISGDFIYHAFKGTEPEVARVVDLVRPLPEAGIPTYGVLGNHDYGMNTLNSPPLETLALRLEEALERAGIEILENEAVKLVLPGNPDEENSEAFYLVGIGSHLADKERVKDAIANIAPTDPRFVMMHNPRSFLALPSNTAPVAIAGHTHGGQIRLPLTPQWSWLTATKEMEHVDGWSDGYGASGNQLYVNRGIGFSEVPLRINCPPEVTIFTLQSQ